MDSAPVPPDVRCCSKSDRLRRECEMTLRAMRRHRLPHLGFLVPSTALLRLVRLERPNHTCYALPSGRYRTGGRGDRRKETRRAAGCARSGLVLEPARRLPPGDAAALRRGRSALPYQSDPVRHREIDRRSRGDRSFSALLRGRAVRYGLAAHLSDVLRRGGELSQPAQAAHALPL